MRYDRAVANREIAERLKAVREQIKRIHDEISFLLITVELEQADDQFKNYNVQDRITTLSIAVRNNAAEMDSLWKLSR